MKKPVTYSYCVDERDQLICIKSLKDATRHDHNYFCLQCGHEMVPNLGEKNAWHFSHKTDTKCDKESYLHKLAKRRIREKFMSNDNFPITFKRDISCQEKQNCLFYNNYCIKRNVPIKKDLKTYNGCLIYDRCTEEIFERPFKPDLLLTNSKKESREPVFIEIYKDHKCSEEKIKSNYRIIETKKITSESDIDEIIEKGFIENNNCTLYNFQLKELPKIRKKDIPIKRFILFKSGKVYIHGGIDGSINCDKRKIKINPYSEFELNMNEIGLIDENSRLSPIQKGLIYLHKKGVRIRNCHICKFHRFNNFHNHDICIKYKQLGLHEPKPEQDTAQSCNYYEVDHNLNNYALSELEKEIEFVSSPAGGVSVP